MKRVLAAILGAHLLVPSLTALEVRFEGDGCPLPSNVVQTVTAELSRLVLANRALFQRLPAPDFRITYRIHRDRAEFRAAAKTASNAYAGVAGFTQTEQRWQLPPARRLVSVNARVETWREQRTNELLAVLLHESAHAVTAAFVGRTPLWFNEGSAELLGTPAAARYKFHRQDESQRWRTLATLLDQGELPALRDFLVARSYAEWERLFGGDRSRAYTASYSLFYFFSAQPAAFRFLAAWLDSRPIEESEDLDGAFADYLDKHWPGGLGAFEAQWHVWIKARAVATRRGAPTPAGPMRR